jgi:uncharacterized protein YcaQ
LNFTYLYIWSLKQNHEEMDAQEQVLNAMAQAGKALKAGELVDLTGLGRPEVDKVLKQLKKEEKIVSPKVCYWEPKK